MHFRMFFIMANDMMKIQAEEELRLIRVINAEKTGDKEIFDSIKERIFGKEKAMKESSKVETEKAKVKAFLNKLGV